MPKFPRHSGPGEAPAPAVHELRPGRSTTSPWLQRGLLHRCRRQSGGPLLDPQAADAAPCGVENCILPVADLRQNHMRNKPDHEKTSSSQDTRSSAATGQARQPARRTAGVETRHTAREEIELRPSRRQQPAGVEAHRRPGQAFRQREEKTGTEFQPELQTRHAQPRP